MADYDVVIIGSGVAGALCAAGLAGDSRKILVLEAAENSLGVFQREQFKRTWDPATRKTWNTPYLSTTGIRNYPSPVNDDINTYFDQTLTPPGRALPPSRVPISGWPAARPGLGVATPRAFSRTTSG